MTDPFNPYEKDQLALKEFNRLLPQLRSYATSLVGRRVKVQAGANNSTNGETIFLRPPIALAERYDHQRNLCGQRDETGFLECHACRVREDLMGGLHHEIAHIVHESFKRWGLPQVQSKIGNDILDIVSGKQAMGFYDWWEKNFHRKQLAVCQFAGQIDKHLAHVMMFADDMRINEETYKDRPGLRAQHWARYETLIRDGVRSIDGQVVMWNQRPLDHQALALMLFKAHGVRVDAPRLHEDVQVINTDPELNKLLKQVTQASHTMKCLQLSVKILARLRALGFFKQESQDDQPEEDLPMFREPADEQDEEENGDESQDQQQSNNDGSRGEEREQNDEEEASASEDSDKSSDGKPSESDRGKDGDESQDAESGESNSSTASSSAGDGDSSDGDADTATEEVPDDGAENDSSESGRGPSEEDEASGGEADPDEQEGSGGEPDASGEADQSGDSDESSGDGREGGSDSQPDDESNSSEGDDADGQSGADPQQGEQDAASDPSRSGEDSNEGSPQEGGGSSGGGTGDSSGSDSDGGSGASDGGLGDVSPKQGGSLDGLRSVLQTLLGHGEESTEHVQEDQQLAVGEPANGDRGVKEADLDRKPQDSYSNDLNEGEDTMAKVIEAMWHLDRVPRNLGGVKVHKPGLGPAYGSSYRNAFGEPVQKPTESTIGRAVSEARIAFAVNARVDHVRNQKRGRIAPRVLGKRAGIGDERLFEKKTVPNKRNYAVCIGYDVSMSTAGMRHKLITDCVYALAEVCNRVGIDFSIYCHSTEGRVMELNLSISTVKEWEEKWTPQVQVRLSQIGPVSGNLDGHSMQYYRKKLDEVRATDKILIYFTDGAMPAANYDEELEVLQDEIKVCKQRGYTLLGVGINTNSPEEHGLETVEVDGPADIRLVVAQLRKKIAGF